MWRYGLVVSKGPSIRGGTTSLKYPWGHTEAQGNHFTFFFFFFLSRLSVEQTVKWSLKQTSQYILQKPEEWIQHMLTTGCDFPVCWQTSDLVTSTVNGVQNPPEFAELNGTPHRTMGTSDTGHGRCCQRWSCSCSHSRASQRVCYLH